jgi:hypothetical protein
MRITKKSWCQMRWEQICSLFPIPVVLYKVQVVSGQVCCLYNLLARLLESVEEVRHATIAPSRQQPKQPRSSKMTSNTPPTKSLLRTNYKCVVVHEVSKQDRPEFCHPFQVQAKQVISPSTHYHGGTEAILLTICARAIFSQSSRDPRDSAHKM